MKIAGKTNYLFRRAAAYLIDCFVAFAAVMIVIQWLLLSNVRGSFGITDEFFRNSLQLEFYVLLTISFPVWIYFTLLDSKLSKGTIGKRLMSLSLHKADSSERITVFKSFLRTIIKLLPWEIIHLGIIFPAPLYYEEAFEFRFLFIAGQLLFVFYFLTILFSSMNQVFYDRLLKLNVTRNSQH